MRVSFLYSDVPITHYCLYNVIRRFLPRVRITTPTIYYILVPNSNLTTSSAKVEISVGVHCAPPSTGGHVAPGCKSLLGKVKSSLHVVDHRTNQAFHMNKYHTNQA